MIIKVEFIPQKKKDPFSMELSLSPINGPNVSIMEDNIIQQKLFLRKFKGSEKPGNTISCSQNQEHLYLNNKNENLKILTNINLDYSDSKPKKMQEYSAEIPIFVKNKITQIKGYGSDKVILLTKDNKIKIIKFTTFGFSEVITEHSSVTENSEDKLDSLALCPKRNYIILLAKNPLLNYHKIVVLRLKKVENLGKGGYKIKILSLFRTSINLSNPVSVHISIPFYFEGKPVLSIAEAGQSNSRLYFYLFDDEKCSMMKNLSFPDNNRIVALRCKNGALIKINNVGDILRLRVNY